MKTRSFFCLLFLLSNTIFAQSDWENPAIFQRNQTEAHVPVTPFVSLDEAVQGKREANDYFLSLNGQWKFKWVESLSTLRTCHFATRTTITWEL